jgi:hypothetical protein
MTAGLRRHDFVNNSGRQPQRDDSELAMGMKTQPMVGWSHGFEFLILIFFLSLAGTMQSGVRPSSGAASSESGEM